MELSTHTREHHLQSMAAQPLDVLVVGGGITGAGVALDAALRGLRVGLVEREDFSSGTSSRSSKMIHGGLRYLATGDVRLVREALVERRGIQRRAAHLVRPLPMAMPIYGARIPTQRMKIGTGLWAYDVLGAWRAGVRHSWHDARSALRQASNLDPQGLVGAFSYQDSQADDVRLVLAVVRTAAQHGAKVANRARVTSLLEHGERVCGARVQEAGGGIREIEARVVVNATGVWADRFYAEIGHAAGFEILPSKGIHIVVPRDVAGIVSGVGFFSRTGSNLFIEPWADDLAVIGTTDTPYGGDIEDLHATQAEVRALLDTVNAFLHRPIDHREVVGHWAGVRPLVMPTESHSERTEDVSRNHRVVETPGLVSLVGGKLTTYRAMAEEGVDAAVRQLERPVRSCSTHELPLVGATLCSTTAAVDDYVYRYSLPRGTVRHLIRRYGQEIDKVMRMCEKEPDLADPLHPERPDIAAEALFAARHEMANDADDVLGRRTRLAIETRDCGRQAVSTIEQVLAERMAGA